MCPSLIVSVKRGIGTNVTQFLHKISIVSAWRDGLSVKLVGESLRLELPKNFVACGIKKGGIVVYIEAHFFG